MTDNRPWQWVACSITEFGHVGEQRHLARKGAHTTYCSHSATYPEIWRKNSTKPKCKTCEQAESRLIPAEDPAPADGSPGPHHCPTCGANAPGDECASRTGRDHPSRRLWARAYAAGRRSALPPEEGDTDD